MGAQAEAGSAAIALRHAGLWRPPGSVGPTRWFFFCFFFLPLVQVASLGRFSLFDIFTISLALSRSLSLSLSLARSLCRAMANKKGIGSFFKKEARKGPAKTEAELLGQPAISPDDVMALAGPCEGDGRKRGSWA